jgi:putative transcriptional regulator
MTADSAPINLTHHFLIAMPGLDDAIFSRSVVYLCEHSERGALGLVINKPSDLSMRTLFEKVELSLQRDDLATQPVLKGGPVHTERGFVLHEPMSGVRTDADPSGADALANPSLNPSSSVTGAAGDIPTDDGAKSASDAQDAPSPPETGVQETELAYASTLRIPGGLEMTTSKDVLEALASGAGPKRVLISLGYAAWGQGQLESEIAENSWLTVSADTRIIFDTPIEQRYEQAMGLLGLQPWMISKDVGHA